jgi:hypothetical protein
MKLELELVAKSLIEKMGRFFKLSVNDESEIIAYKNGIEDVLDAISEMNPQYVYDIHKLREEIMEEIEKVYLSDSELPNVLE